RSIAINPAYMIAHLNLAFVLANVGEVKESERHLGAVLAREPRNTAAAFKLAEIRSGRVDPRRGVRRQAPVPAGGSARAGATTDRGGRATCTACRLRR